MNQKIAETEPPPQPQLDGGIPNFTVLLSSTPRGARLARLLAADQLRSWGLPTDPATLIVAELAANAATHGRLPGRSFRVTLYVVGPTLRIEVTDTRGDRLPRLQEPDARAESGRGLLLVDALADRWDVSEGRFPRKTVWAELCLPAPQKCRDPRRE
ncbi:ATP-binding protein [Streptomyces alanosinicus]|uniref:ATP-binding protein n=1 Tax=Streptomyces alanosinicus TaxID=68171 RepID=A0A919D015_9ACTN|nr:ATP-binding protein [Streptomyces alanosinicus]GHE00209.1 ATP-binding protein [Streptomyces alanosinicus]